MKTLLIGLGLFALQADAQTDRIIPGPPPDEYVDVTGDGIADLLITTSTVHITDPQQPGYLGRYKHGVRTLSGNAILLWSTPSTQRWYTLEDSTRLDTHLIAERIHFKQVSWTDEDQPTEFWLLERPFGPAIGRDQDGWYGTGDHHDGHTMVLRSTNERGTSVAAFAFELPYPHSRVMIKIRHAVRVPNGYGKEGDPLLPLRAHREPLFDFGHEPVHPQTIIPPGIPPDERVNLNGDMMDDLVITAQVEFDQENNASYVSGISPLPGTGFLVTIERWGVPGLFRLREGEVLAPERLAAGLRSNLFSWANADSADVFFPVLRHPVGTPGSAPDWMRSDGPFDGALVYRTMEHDRPIIGTLEIIAETPGGQFGVRPQTWVDEGHVLEVR
ncbi:MAG: hypothetical protein IPJ76_14830 [Flavobacteriales bacterium]|nr:MAG: hypothetical protein IPJ76_14830 [Flavobacteriales bacterium]